VFLLIACLQHAFSVQSADVLRSLRQHESVRPVAQQNAQPKPPSHIVSAMIERHALFISIVDGLIIEKSIDMRILGVEMDNHPRAISNYLKQSISAASFRDVFV
jgi:hypothetical protein